MFHYYSMISHESYLQSPSCVGHLKQGNWTKFINITKCHSRCVQGTDQMYPSVRKWLKIMISEARPEVIKLFPCSTQLSTKFILLINVEMPTIVEILTFMGMINTTSERLKARKFFICQYFSFHEQLKFHAQLS